MRITLEDLIELVEEKVPAPIVEVLPDIVEVIVCECCALELLNDDVSSCRDFYNHTHSPADREVTVGPVVSFEIGYDGTNCNSCGRYIREEFAFTGTRKVIYNV